MDEDLAELIEHIPGEDLGRIIWLLNAEITEDMSEDEVVEAYKTLLREYLAKHN